MRSVTRTGFRALMGTRQLVPNMANTYLPKRVVV